MWESSQRQDGKATHLGEDVSIGVILQQHSSCASVIVAGCNVQGGQADLTLCPIVDKVSNHVLVPLLQSHS